MKVSMEDTMTTGFFGFDKTGNIVYMLDSRDRNTGTLKELNIETGKSTLLAEDDKADMDVFTSHPTENTVQTVA